jgi:hypothetical protein
MALAGGHREVLTIEQQRESDSLEEEVSAICKWWFESDKKGRWLGMEERVLTWDRL